LRRTESKLSERVATKRPSRNNKSGFEIFTNRRTKKQQRTQSQA
jgi:hypothetical protein